MKRRIFVILGFSFFSWSRKNENEFKGLSLRGSRGIVWEYRRMIVRFFVCSGINLIKKNQTLSENSKMNKIKSSKNSNVKKIVLK